MGEFFLPILDRTIEGVVYIVYTMRYLKGDDTMVKHLTRHGNSAALILDSAILELLHISMKTPLELATDGRNLIVSPIRQEKREQRFRSALEAVNRRHEKTLRAFAK